MTLNLIPKLKEKYPNYEIDYFCHPSIGNNLEQFFKLAGISKWYDFNSLGEHQSKYEHIFNMVGYPIPPKGNYPEEPMNKHLLQYFADEVDIDSTELPQLCINKKPEAIVKDSYITIHPKAGWSMYKNWSMTNWEKLIAKIRLESTVPVNFIQIGAADDYKLEGANHSFMGKSLIESINLIANANLHLGVDSFSNHLTHILWEDERTPAVILWGSTQASAAGYEENCNISLGLSCQPCFRESPGISNMTRGICPNPPEQTYDAPNHLCMSKISVDMVLEKIREYLNETM